MVSVLLGENLGVVEIESFVGEIDLRLGRPHLDFGIDQMDMADCVRLALPAHHVDLVGLEHAAALGHDGIALHIKGIGLGVVNRFLAGDVDRLFVRSLYRCRNSCAMGSG